MPNITVIGNASTQEYTESSMQQILSFNLFHQVTIVFGIMTNHTVILIHQNAFVFEHETALDGVHSGIGGGSGSLAHGGVRGEGGGERERCCYLREGEGRKRK
ncbi:hypothetical protein P7M08_24165, partial [Vibrio parahaemolyticus]|nr:hypothetical protein [Vibrio parahaemolyticus]NMR86021.1 hypothetical protein [Vibrio parahaemolyticus]